MEREAVSRDAQTGTPAALVDRPAGILRLPDEAPTLKDADELTRRKALADWLAERGKDHFQDRIAPAILRRAAGQLWTDRQEARRQGVAAPGQAEYLDLRLYPFWEDA